MKKLVILKFDGNFELGFQVNLEIANEGQRAYRTTTAKLPENINIPQLLNNWHEIYCSRYSQFRVKSGGSRRVNLESLNQECTRESINLLACFNQWLNASSFKEVINYLQELNPQDEIRIIITTSCHELRQLPWHLWDVLINFTLLEVALSSPNAEQGERALREKIRILIILGDSSNIDVEADKKLLHNFCGDDAEIVLLKQPSREELNNYLQDNLGWDILFFSGHSQTQEMRGRIYLNHHESLTMGELRDALQVAIQRRLQIAFFNSCDGLGIAYELEQLHIPQVIVMRKPVPDIVAQEFLKYFLQEFTGGKSLYISVRNARVELQQLESEFPCASWLPVIVQNQTETPPTWQSLGIISFCPYQGLSAFKEENAEYFFGRDKATLGLVSAVNSKPLVAVVGASGSGKSSLVFAGLIPQLRQDNNWLILSFRPGKNPFAALAVALVSALNLPDNERRLAELELDVNLQRDSTSLERFITSPLTRLLGGNNGRILLIADQFEEIYTLCTDAEERKIFLDGLLQAVNNAPFFTLLLTLRADFLSRALDDYEPFGRALQRYQLEPVVRMNRKELEAAITLPARQLGFEFEEGLCNTIIDDIEDGDGRLPLLEFTLTQLWKQQYAGILTHQAYKKIGGVEQALANYAEMVYADLREGERETAQRVFIQLVQPGEGTEDTRKLATSEEVGGENWDLVTRLADKRLVVTNWDELSHEETVEVVHEALIRHWGRLRGWMQENRKFRIWQQGLMVALQQWVESGKDEGALLRGATLAVAEDWLQQRGGEVSKPQRWFIEKGVELRERERKQKERFRRSVIGGLVCGLVMISGFGAVSEIRRINSEVSQLSLSSEKNFQQNRQEEALTGVIKAGKLLKSFWNPWITAENRMQAISTLREVVYGFNVKSLKGHTSFVGSVSFSPDGKTLASASGDKTVKLWDINTSREIKTLKGHIYSVNSVSFSSDGKTLASASQDSTVKLWDINSGRELKTLIGHTDPVYSVSFSPDGKTLASASLDSTVKLWDVNSGREIKTLKGHNIYSVNSVSFSPDGKTLASAPGDKTVKLWDVNSGRELKTLKGHTFPVNSVSFSPDGKTFASASGDKTVKLWDVNSGRELKTLKGHTSSVRSVSFSPDGKTIASVSWDEAVKLWDINSGREIKTLKGHTSSVNSVSFSPDGKTIASASDDGTVKLWDINSGREITILKGHKFYVESVSFSPDGKTIASASDDRTVKLWDINTGREIKTLKGHTSSVNSVSFSPDGKTLASVSVDSTVKLWDINSGREIKTLIGHTSSVTSVSFSPDGKTLASASLDKTVKLWDINTGREIKTLIGHTSSVTSVSFTPDGKTLASVSVDSTVKLWDINSGRELKTLKGRISSVRSVSFSPDGKTLASASGDKTVKLWDVNSGRELKTLIGHTESVLSVSFSLDGKTLASASADKTVKLWDVNSGRELKTLIGHTKYVTSVSLSPDGKTLASASADRTIILWNFDLDDLLVRGCGLIRNYLPNNPDVSAEDRHLCDNIKNN
ncbi:CHAT domain-containing protein [Plectonema cf. radiosum LEGE 06105]|uniref:CHAT domain-containing protein n=1 Tax=Plectonema cf. radiosum LEGE 06105 TaxID=945769 RepID=A0A8J7F530_9CYAN|nr:CHAT domain-containing protein [Plectonema radiosum]MBE9215402.1 CHAT domain-containing protein [Plectonema cf. radiosum LEGE 06105]